MASVDLEASGRRRPNVVLGSFLALTMAVGPFVHYAVSALGPLIVADIAMSRAAFGNLWFVAFAAAALSSVLGGRVTDRSGARLVLGFVFGLSALAMLTAGVSRSYIGLMVALALSGIAQSASNPVTNSLVSGGVAPRSQGVLLGVKQSGVQIAQFVAGAALPISAAAIGWRTALLLAAVPATAGALLVRRCAPAAGARTVPRSGASSAATRRLVRWVTAYAFLMGVVTQATNVYLPLYGFETLGLSAAVAGASTAVLGGVGAVARIVWGRSASRFPTIQMVLATLAVVSALATAMIAAAPGVGRPELYWSGAALFAISALAVNVVLTLGIVRRVSVADVGKASGWMALGLYAGFMAGPSAFGAFVDAVGSYTPAWTGSLLASLGAAVLALVWGRIGSIPTSDHASPVTAPR